ncbi:MAG: efflux RND transporter periplasmic adaptor subunit [Parachlamydiaceae bacterium]
MFRKIVVFILLLGVACGIVLYYLYEEKNRDTDIVLYGNIDVRQVDLSFRVEGRVSEMFFEEGDLVPTGALVGILDKQPYVDQVFQSEAQLDSVRSSLVNADILLKRRLELIGDGSISQEDLDNATMNKLVLDGSVKSSEAALAISKTNLTFTECFAPTDGIVLSRVREPGTVVRVSDPIYTLSIISPVWVRAFIPEPLLGVVTPGMKADIYTDTKGGTVYHGHVGFISPVAEFTPKTVETTQLRTDLVYRLRIYADNPDQGLRQGMPVTVRLKK